MALEQLGFGPCDHIFQFMDQTDRARTWRGIGEGKRPDWPELFDGYQAAVDWPCAAYWQELADAFPKAKVILTVRDPEHWFDSTLSTMTRFPLRRHGWVERSVFAMFSRLHPASLAVPMMLDKILWDRVFDGRVFDGSNSDRQYAIDAYRRHNDQVKAYVPAERLLVLRVADGWEPLCAFLGVPVPAEPFPRVNDARAFNRRIAARVGSAVLRVAGGLSAVAAAAAAAITALAGGGIARAGLAAAAAAGLIAAWFAATNGIIYLSRRRREQRASRVGRQPQAAS